MEKTNLFGNNKVVVVNVKGNLEKDYLTNHVEEINELTKSIRFVNLCNEFKTHPSLYQYDNYQYLGEGEDIKVGITDRSSKLINDIIGRKELIKVLEDTEIVEGFETNKKVDLTYDRDLGIVTAYNNDNGILQILGEGQFMAVGGNHYEEWSYVEGIQFNLKESLDNLIRSIKEVKEVYISTEVFTRDNEEVLNTVRKVLGGDIKVYGSGTFVLCKDASESRMYIREGLPELEKAIDEKEKCLEDEEEFRKSIIDVISKCRVSNSLNVAPKILGVMNSVERRSGRNRLKDNEHKYLEYEISKLCGADMDRNRRKIGLTRKEISRITENYSTENTMPPLSIKELYTREVDIIKGYEAIRTRDGHFCITDYKTVIQLIHPDKKHRFKVDYNYIDETVYEVLSKMGKRLLGFPRIELWFTEGYNHAEILEVFDISKLQYDVTHFPDEATKLPYDVTYFLDAATKFDVILKEDK